MDSQAEKFAICRHIKTNGHRCQSPAITGAVFCYYHRILRRRHGPAFTAKAGPLRPETVQYLLENGQTFSPSPVLHFPLLEDAESVQLAISLLFAAIAARQVDPVLARSLLYALQVASSNLRVLPSGSAPGDDLSTLARRVVRTRDGQALAARGSGNGIPLESESREARFAAMLDDLIHPKDTPPDDSSQTTTPTE